jgi:leader peptidase (prepilin peptidase)/N-methyltransferase
MVGRVSLVIAGAGVLGLVAGAYVRVLAGGFRTADDLGDERSAWRAEARSAFRGALRAVPVPAWPPSIEVSAAVVCALVAWRVEGLLQQDAAAAGGTVGGRWPVGAFTVLAWLYAAVAGCALAVIDWRTQRLPDAITLPSCPILAALLAPTGHLAGALLGGLALAGVYGIMWLVRPAALGLGDVKLAGLAGMLAGTLGVDAWLVAAIGGQFLGALYAIALLATRRGTLQTQFPLGPFILLGTLAALLL